jgi:CRISPR-associated protein Csb2
MSFLTLQVHFIAHSYSGIRLRDGRFEELDWPPSPGRVLEALLSAALLGTKLSDQQLKETNAAFCWFETLPAPEIWAAAQDQTLRTRSRLAIPQNNPNKNKLDQHSILLAPMLKAVSRTDDPLEIRYHWAIEETPETERYLEILQDAAARVPYLGRAEDRAELNLAITAEPKSARLVRWTPQPDGDTFLWVPRAGTTKGLFDRYKKPPQWRQLKRAAQDWMERRPYSDDAPRPRQPIEVAIFQLFPDNDDPDVVPLSCDPESSGLWREFFRKHIVDHARNAAYWDEPELAVELLSGHAANGQPARRPHLAVVPLPTFNRDHTADGRVRRVALIGYASSDVESHAREIYRTLFRALDGFVEEVESPFSKTGVFPVRLHQVSRHNDGIWSPLCGKSHLWCSLTPSAISRGFTIPKHTPDGRPLSSNERYQRKLSEWARLLRDSLRHVNLPDQLIAETLIEISATPFLPRLRRAERYRAPGEKAVLTHVRLTFPEPVRGPIVLGDRRYFGFGLCAPVLIGRQTAWTEGMKRKAR